METIGRRRIRGNTDAVLSYVVDPIKINKHSILMRLGISLISVSRNQDGDLLKNKGYET
jgi:hypothetical protein